MPHQSQSVVLLLANLNKEVCRVCVIAGDISPIDVITHLPVFCEDRDVPYIFVPSKEVQPAQVHALSSKLPKLSGTPAASRGEDATISWHKGYRNSRPL